MEVSTEFSFSISHDMTISLVNDSRLDTNVDLVSPRLYYIILKSQLVLRTFICIGGMLGNLVNFVTFLRMGLEDSVTVAFFNLAISDFFVLAIIMTSTMASFCETLERDLQVYFLFDPFYVLVGGATIGRTFIYSTALITTFLAIQRCLCVVKPLHFKGAFTRYRSCVVMVLIWIFCLVCGLTFVSFYKFKKETTPENNSTVFLMLLRPGRRYILGFLNIGVNIILNPLCVLLVFVCVLVMANALRKSAQFRQAASTSQFSGNQKDRTGFSDLDRTKDKENAAAQTSKASSNSKERQVILQVSIVSAVFLISNTPAVIMAIASTVEPQYELFKRYHYLFWTCFEFRFTIECINSAVNFFIYYKYNSKFRKLCFKKKLKQ